MTVAARTISLVAAIAAAVAVAACDPASTPREPTSGPNPASTVTAARHATLSGPSGYTLHTVEFVDATHGYAQLISRDPVQGASFGSALFATVDAGRSWRRLTDPRTANTSPQLYTVDSSTVILWADDSWYVSTDGGASFHRRPSEPAPVELSRIGGRRYTLDCAGTGCVVLDDAGRPGSINQPTLPGNLGGVADADGALWVASAKDGMAYTAVSTDHGGHWRTVKVPDHPAGRPDRVTVQTAGGDVWLVGFLPAAGSAMGRAFPLRRKESGAPLLWLRVGENWVAKATVGAPTSAMGVYTVAPAGGGLAVVNAPGGLYLVDDSWHAVRMFPLVEWVTTLADDTLFGSAITNRTFYLGTRTGVRVDWTQLVLDVA